MRAPRWSDVWISALARSIDSGGDALAAFALALVLQSRGYGGVAIAALMLAASVPPIVLARPAGWVADTFDSRRILLTVGSMQVAVCAALAFVTSVYAIVALVALLTVGATLTSPTFSALTPAMVGRDNLAKASGLMQGASTLAGLIAPVIGGLLVGAFHGARGPLLIDAATCLAVPAAGLLIRTRRCNGLAYAGPALDQEADETAEGGPDTSIDTSGSATAWTIFKDPIVRPVVLLFAAVVGAVTAVNVAEVFLVRGTLHASAAMYGIVSATWMGGMFVGSVSAARMRPDDGRSARIMLALLGAVCLIPAAAALVGSVVWLLPLWFVGGILNGGQNTISGVLVGRRAPAAVRGRAYAAFGGTMSTAMTAGMALGGVLLSFAGPRAIFGWTGVAGLAVTFAFAGPLLAATRRGHPTATPVLNSAAPAAPVPEASH